MQLKSTLYFPESGNEYEAVRRITPPGLQKALKKCIRRAHRAGAKVLIEDTRALAVYPHYEVYWQVV